MTSPHPVVLPRRIVFALVPAVLLVLGCDSPHSLGAAPGAAGGGTTGAAGLTSGTAGRGGAGGAVTGLGGAAGAGGDAAGAGGGAAGAGGGAAGVGGGPACSDAVPCGQNLFCKRDPSNACGAAILAGHCVEPEPCPANVSLVCGCDGRTYSNDLRSDERRRRARSLERVLRQWRQWRQRRPRRRRNRRRRRGRQRGRDRRGHELRGLQPLNAVLREHHRRRLRQRHPFHGVLPAPRRLRCHTDLRLPGDRRLQHDLQHHERRPGRRLPGALTLHTEGRHAGARHPTCVCPFPARSPFSGARPIR